jgi:hypothetical protein
MNLKLVLKSPLFLNFKTGYIVKGKERFVNMIVGITKISVLVSNAFSNQRNEMPK